MGGSSQVQAPTDRQQSWSIDPATAGQFNDYSNAVMLPGEGMSSTGQTGPFSSLGSDPTNSMQMGGNMLTSTPPTGAGTMQPLVGTIGQSGGQVGPPTQPGPGQSVLPTLPGSGQVEPPTQPEPGQNSPFSSQPAPWSGGQMDGSMNLFGGGQQNQFMQQIMQMLMRGGGGNA